MPRQPRTFEPGGLYHLFSRGSCRREISIDDGDRIDFLVCAERAFARHGMECLTYVLMPNHYHFVVHTPNGAISAPMKELNGRYSLRFNRRHGRVAHTFKNRFGAVHLKREGHMLWATAYVAANPVRAGLCPRPEDWPWSSYRATMGLEQALGLFKAARLLSYFGSIEADARRVTTPRSSQIARVSTAPGARCQTPGFTDQPETTSWSPAPRRTAVELW